MVMGLLLKSLDPHIVTGVPEHHILIALCEGLTSSNPKGGESAHKNVLGVAIRLYLYLQD